MAAGCLSLVSWLSFGCNKCLLFLFSFPTVSLAALLIMIVMFLWQDVPTGALLYFLTSSVKTSKNLKKTYNLWRSSFFAVRVASVEFPLSFSLSLEGSYFLSQRSVLGIGCRGRFDISVKRDCWYVTSNFLCVGLSK